MPDTSINGEQLAGVSATSLWTLHNRATEAARDDGIIDDPLAIELHERIDYDFDKFGKPSQSHPLRALAFDRAIAAYAAAHPGATIVALGEGLQTSFWRVNNPQLTWLSVDVPPVMKLRAQLLPEEPAITPLAQSALDLDWMDHVDPEPGVFISAEGLLMYFEPDQALELIAACAARFPGGQFMFDSIPQWFSAKTLRGYATTDRYTTPPMPFSLTRAQAVSLPARIPGIAAAHEVSLPPGRGPWANPVLRASAHIPLLRNLRPTITLLTFDE